MSLFNSSIFLVLILCSSRWVRVLSSSGRLLLLDCASSVSTLCRREALLVFNSCTRASVSERQWVMYSYFCLRMCSLVVWKGSFPDALREFPRRTEWECMAVSLIIVFKVGRKVSGEGERRGSIGACIIYHLQMDIERNSRASRASRLSNHQADRSSYRSSVMSLERISDHRHSSLSRRVSLVSAMQLEQSHGSAPHDDLLSHHYAPPLAELQRLSGKSRQDYSFDVEEKDLARKSQCKISHECGCGEECQGVHCSCFLTPREICVIGQCCPSCIASKNDFLQQTRGFSVRRGSRDHQQTGNEEGALAQLLRQRNCKNMHYMKQVFAKEPCMKDLIFCTCKKSQCQKKYCLCFERGVKCGQFCVCVQCLNRQHNEDDDFHEEQQRRWERYATYVPYDEEEELRQQEQIDPDIEQFLEQPVQNTPFVETMEFQPVNFDSFIAQS